MGTGQEFVKRARSDSRLLDKQRTWSNIPGRTRFRRDSEDKRGGGRKRVRHKKIRNPNPNHYHKNKLLFSIKKWPLFTPTRSTPTPRSLLSSRWSGSSRW